MLGSLVLIFPTPHEGGELVLRHKDREWKFDAKSLTTSQSSPSLAYVAFYSDTEHEVLKVTSGRRITLTYNLYLVNPALRPEASAVAPNFKSISNLQTTLQGSLKSPEFLPGGGMLGFGLAHLYPVTFGTKLQDLASYLKGEDAHVYRACREAQLQPLLRMVYDDNQSGASEYGIMLDQIVKDPDYDYECNSYEGALLGDLGGVVINKTEDAEVDDSEWISEDDHQGETITWISPFNERNKLEDVRTMYGNQVEMGYTYCSPCIIVRIPAASDRA
jgi:hypothetical protein